MNIGPQHPSTHGVFRLRVTFDGEEILEVEPIFGYLHRGTEKLAEERNYTQIVTLTDRLDYVSSMINNQAYCLAVEQLLGVEVPQRAKISAHADRRTAAGGEPPDGHRLLPTRPWYPGHTIDVRLQVQGADT